MMGQVLSELGGAKAGRMALLHAGYPYTTTYSTINRQCSSGLQAITSTAHSILTGQHAIAIGGGVESMTRNYGTRAIPVDLSPILSSSPNQDAQDCIMPMGLTSENVAERYGITRGQQDELAAWSHQRAAAAQSAGLFADEIVPTSTRFIAEDGTESQIIVSADDGIRPTTTTASLAKLKPAFKPTGTSTAGNSSQVSDGAAAALLMKRSTATALGLQPIGKFVASAVAGVKPDEMGIGPAVAIPRLLEMTGVRKEEVNVWELNEAFASQALYCVRELGLEGVMEERVNPRGGAIALGHPLGATGARMVTTLLAELGRRGEQLGVVSMCIGTGSGMASLFVRE